MVTALGARLVLAAAAVAVVIQYTFLMYAGGMVPPSIVSGAAERSSSSSTSVRGVVRGHPTHVTRATPSTSTLRAHFRTRARGGGTRRRRSS